MSIGFPNLGIFLEWVGKSFSVFGFEIAYYGVVVTLGMAVGISICIREAKRTGQDGEMYLDLLMFTMLTSIIGARLYYVIFSWDYYKTDLLQIFNIRNGGLAIYGGIIAGALTIFIFCRVKKVSFSLMADTVAMGLVTGQIIGRWGNFFNREAFGDYTDGLLAMQLPVSAVRQDEITQTMWEHMEIIDGIEYIQVHPTFLYEGLWNLGVLLVLVFYRKKKKFQGEVFLLYLVGYGLGRFWIESLRTDQLLLPVVGIPVSQLLSSILVVGACGGILWNRKKAKKNILNNSTKNPENEN